MSDSYQSGLSTLELSEEYEDRRLVVATYRITWPTGDPCRENRIRWISSFGSRALHSTPKIQPTVHPAARSAGEQARLGPRRRPMGLIAEVVRYGWMTS